MLRIPVENTGFRIEPDPDVLRSWNWFMSLFSKSEWEERRASVEDKIRVRPQSADPFSKSLDQGILQVVNDDQIGWYLYLVETYLFEPHKYEFFQGARIVPIFKRLGQDLEELLQIDGIRRKVKNIIKVRKSEADPLIFEILVALLWKKNGWITTFLNESKTGKTPDLKVEKGGETFFIECKRQKKSSDYVYRETKKRQILISHINKELLKRNLLLDIVFHVELESLEDTYLKELFSEYFNSSTIPSNICVPGILDIRISGINIQKVNSYLENYLVKNHSPILNYLIGGKSMDNLAFTSGLIGKFYRIGDGEVGNEFVGAIRNAYGVISYCDAEGAVSAKARDIKGQLHSALSQFQPKQNVIVYIGMETFDGPEVESKRLGKIQVTLNDLGIKGADLKWLFLHFFQSYSTPKQNWVLDETVKSFGNIESIKKMPLKSRHLIAETDENFALEHWERPLPE